MTTIRDIAKAANVSLSTVSKALNNRHDVSQGTRRRILDIADELNFHASTFGKGLKNKRTENIGVIFCRESRPLSLNPFYSRVLEGIEAELAINNYNLVLHLLPEVYHGEYPKMLKERHVDGVVLVGVLQENFIHQLSNDKIPTILVDPKFATDNFSQILIDNEHGAFLATQYLIKHGHTKIAFISGDLDRESFRQRFIGFKKAMNHHRLKVEQDYVQIGGLEEGYEQVDALVKMKDRPTAIFATNDLNAIYGYKAIKDNGLHIPEDISMVGFDDIAMAKMTTPPLTTIRVYKEEMGSIAVRILLKIVKKTIINPITTLVPIRLIERDSVTPIIKTKEDKNRVKIKINGTV